MFYRLLAEFDPPRAAEERARLIAKLEPMRHRLTDEENEEFDRAIAEHRRLMH